MFLRSNWFISLSEIENSARYVSLSGSGKGINIVIGGDTPGMGYVLTAPVSAVLKLIAGCIRGVSLDIAPLNSDGKNDAEEGKTKQNH